MESNDIQESDKEANNSDNKTADISSAEGETLDTYQEQSIASEQPTSTENDSFVKLKLRTKAICDKLSIKRQQLQLEQQKSNVEGNSLMKKSDKKVSKAIKTMKVNTQNVEHNGVDKLLYEHSRRELEDLVNGFHRLVLELTSDNRNLIPKVEIAARRISSLKNFPIFSKVQKVSKPKSGRNENGNIEICKASVPSAMELENLKEKDKKYSKIRQAEKFAKYINSILCEYLGKDQKDKLKKYHCLPEHIDNLEEFAIALVQEGYGRIVEEEIRINKKNNRQSFLKMNPDRETSERDAIITLSVARRFAFEGDIVRAFVFNTDVAPTGEVRKICSNLPEDKSSLSLDEDELLDDIEDDSSPETEVNDTLNNSISVKEHCCKAFVIRIVKQTELREVVGSISFTNETTLNRDLYYKLTPHDAKMSMVFIPKESCTEQIKTVGKEDICGMLYVARVLDIDVNGHCIGELVQPVGKVGNLQAELKAILLHNGLKDIKPYEQKYNEMYEMPAPALSVKDLRHREDLRKKCVFTIDPITAKDLDDALSVEKLNDFEYEIGVHISDVSFYLEEYSELDTLVKQRTTSIYLVNEVIHMLPTSLCLRCSLLPGEDKFAFSVFWKWNTEKDELSEPRFTRSIINSCAQFAYEHAQRIIDNPTDELESEEIPNLLNEFQPNDIKWRVLLLHKISQKLKAKRYDDGALSIHNPKLRFQLDPKTGEPVAFATDGRQEANFLIEEFMLLANQSVAKFTHQHFPNKSILRNHAPPLTKSMKALKERLNNLGLEFDISSSKSVYDSIQRIQSQASDPEATEVCLSALLVKPMARARYYCSEGSSSKADFWHYALSIPIYTHFTSPIRRYPDVMVHRLLAAALNYCSAPEMPIDELHQLAKNCNDQKFNAKKAGDESIELYFKRYLKAQQTLTLKAVVTEICENMMNVVTIKTGHTISLVYNAQHCLVHTSDVPKSVSIAVTKSKTPATKLQLFTTVDVIITLKNKNVQGFFALGYKPEGELNPVNNSKKPSSKPDQTSNKCNGMEASKNCDADNTPTTSNKSKKKPKTQISKKDNKDEDYASFYAIAK